jgi:WD40 repeat protein
VHKALVHEPKVTTMALSPTGKVVATGTESGLVRIWDVISGKQLTTLAHTDSILNISFSQDGGHLATASKDKTVRIWAVPSGKLIKKFVHKGSAEQVRFIRNNDQIATNDNQGNLLVWDVNLDRPILEFPHEKQIEFFDVSPDGSQLASASLDGAAHLFSTDVLSSDFPVGDLIGVATTKSSDMVLVSEKAPNVLQYFRLETTDRCHANYDLTRPISSVGISPNSEHIVVGFISGQIEILHVKQGSRFTTRIQLTGPVTRNEFNLAAIESWSKPKRDLSC